MEPAVKKEFGSVIIALVKRTIAPGVSGWLEEKVALIREEDGSAQLNLAFAAVPRKTGRELIKITDDERKVIERVHPHFFINDWTIDRLCRVWLLMQVNPADRDIYIQKMENLFKGAEMNELAALYSSLFFLAFPE